MQFRRFGLSTGVCLIVLLLAACVNDRRQEPPAPTPTLLEIPTAVLPDPTAIPTAAEVVQAQPTAIPVPYSLTGFSVLPVIPYEVPVAADPAPPPALSLTLQLEAAEGAPAPVYQRAEVARIPEETAAELLAQVPLLAGRTDAGTLTLPTARRNPPPTGGVEVHAFRPLAEAAPELTDSNAATELEVVRFFPTGPVDWVPQINIVFSKPMVPLSSHDALAAHVPAVTLSPELAGRMAVAGDAVLIISACRSVGEGHPLLCDIAPGHGCAGWLGAGGGVRRLLRDPSFAADADLAAGPAATSAAPLRLGIQSGY